MKGLFSIPLQLLPDLLRINSEPEHDDHQAVIENLNGSIRHRQGDPAGAVSHFVRARAADRWNVTYSLNLAEALRAAGMVRLTEAALLDALELAPDAFLPNVRYRLFLIQTGRREQVIEEIRAVKEEDRNGMDVLAVAAALHANAGSYDKVDKVLQRMRANADEETLALLLSDPVFRSYVQAVGRSKETP